MSTPVFLSTAIVIGSKPVMVYGSTLLAPPRLALTVARGLPDRISGMLGRGIGRIRGTVKRKDTPANAPLRRRVRLIRERDGLKMRETWSDAATGAYQFDYIDELQRWTVITYDHEHNYRAEVADNLTPELMPGYAPPEAP